MNECTWILTGMCGRDGSLAASWLPCSYFFIILLQEATSPLGWQFRFIRPAPLLLSRQIPRADVAHFVQRRNNESGLDREVSKGRGESLSLE